MKAALAIAVAEIRQHKLVFWAGPLVGLLPLMLNYLVGGVPPPVAQGRESDREFFIWVFAIVLSFAVAVGLGSTVVARDLGERRLGFWLSRPQPLLQYWAGKMAAAYLLALCAFLLAVLPAHLLGSLSWADTGAAVVTKGNRVLQAWLGGLAIATAAASVAGGALRSHSGLLILDVVMLPLVWAAVWFGALNSVFQARTDAVVMLHAMPWLLLATIPILLAAGAAQICIGRLELRRGHVLLSAITWGGLLVFFAGGILASSRYVASATPADLRLPHGVVLHAPPAGRYVSLGGPTTRWSYLYSAGFLLDSKGGSVRLGGFHGLTGFAWSRDGRRFAWSTAAAFTSPLPAAEQPTFSDGPGMEPSIRLQRLDAPGTAPLRLVREHDSAVEAVSANGRILLASHKGKEVVDAESGRTIARSEETLPWGHAAFRSETTIRALRQEGEQSTVVEWDLASGLVVERGSIAFQGERNGRPRILVPTNAWERVLRFDGSGLTLHGVDGSVTATLVNGWPARINGIAGPLSNDRYGCIEEDARGLRLRVFDSTGRLLSDTRFKARFPVDVGGEGELGVLAVGAAAFSDEGQRATFFIDIAAGTIAGRETGLSPALRRWRLRRDTESEDFEPGSFSTRLFLTADGQLVLREPSGGRRVLVTRRSSVSN